MQTKHFVYIILLNQMHVGDCHVVVYVVMGVVVVAFGSSPSAYIRGLIRRIDRGVPNVSCTTKGHFFVFILIFIHLMGRIML